MKKNRAAFGLSKIRGRIVSLLIALLSMGAASAAELYNLDFTGAEVGSWQVLFGAPAIQSSVGPLSDALVFHALSSPGEQIRLPITQAGPRYELECDVLTHNLVNSDYAFTIRLDSPGFQQVDFHGGLNSIYAYQPSPFMNQIVAPISNDAVHHLSVSIDLAANLWSVGIDGVLSANNPFTGTSLQSVRFGLAPWLAGAPNAPATFAALDNVTLAVVPEPGSAVLFVAGMLVCLRRSCTRR